MSSLYHVYLVSLLLALSVLHVFPANIDYEFINNAGETAGISAFYRNIGEHKAKEMLRRATQFIWEIVFQQPEDERKEVEKISLFIDKMDVVSKHHIHGKNYEIHIAINLLQSLFQVRMLISSELARLLQWTNAEIPPKLNEGIVYFVLLGLDENTIEWPKSGEGNSWDERPEITARFLEYCNTKCVGFVAKLNRMMKTSYKDSYFNDLLGMSRDQAWREYRKEHKNS